MDWLVSFATQSNNGNGIVPGLKAWAAGFYGGTESPLKAIQSSRNGFLIMAPPTNKEEILPPWHNRTTSAWLIGRQGYVNGDEKITESSENILLVLLN